MVDIALREMVNLKILDNVWVEDSVLGIFKRDE